MSAAATGLINRYAQAMIHGAAARGFDYNSICHGIGVRSESLLSGRHVFGPESLAVVSRGVKVLMRDEFCGLTASGCPLGSFEVMCELAVSGETLGAALDKAFRFYGILSDDIRFALYKQGQLAAIQVELARPEMDKENFLYEWWLLVWRGVSSWLIGEKIPILAVEFPHAPAAPVAEYTQTFARSCQFLQTQARLCFDRRMLDKPVVRNSEDLKAYLTPTSLDLVSIPGIERTLKARVKNQMKQVFADTQNFPSMEEIAGQYHMCSQTLRRRLEEEGSSYRLVKEEIRREVVMKWLSNLTIPLGEVSRMGGFAESNGLTRAVKSWVGMCPTEYRNNIAGQLSVVSS